MLFSKHKNVTLNPADLNEIKIINEINEIFKFPGLNENPKRRTDNTMAKKTNNDLQTLHRKLMIMQHKPGMKPGAPEV